MRIRDNLTDSRARGSEDAERAGADFSHEESQPRGKNNSFRENEGTREEGATYINLGSMAKPNPPLGGLTPLALACLCTKTLNNLRSKQFNFGEPRRQSRKKHKLWDPSLKAHIAWGQALGSSLLWTKV